jgi:hypothetical protein
MDLSGLSSSIPTRERLVVVKRGTLHEMRYVTMYKHVLQSILPTQRLDAREQSENRVIGFINSWLR